MVVDRFRHVRKASLELVVTFACIAGPLSLGAALLWGTQQWALHPLWMPPALVLLFLVGRWGRPLTFMPARGAQGNLLENPQLRIEFRQMGTITAVYLTASLVAGGLFWMLGFSGLEALLVFPALLPLISFLAGVSVAPQQYHELEDVALGKEARKRIEQLQRWIQWTARQEGVDGEVELKLENNPSPAARSVDRWPLSSERYLVLSHGLMNSFTREQIRAICAHEIAHFTAYDSRKELLLALGAGLLFAPLGWSASQLLTQSPHVSTLLWAMVGIASWMFVVFALLPRLVARTREIPADQKAGAIMGSRRLMARTLAKLGEDNPQAGTGPLDTHPAHEERIQALLAHLPRTS